MEEFISRLHDKADKPLYVREYRATIIALMLKTAIENNDGPASDLPEKRYDLL